MGMVETLWDPFTMDNQEVSWRIPILVYSSTPRKYIGALGSREIKGTHLTSEGTRLWRVLLMLKAKLRSSTVKFFPSTSFKMIEATRNLREFRVSYIGWRRRADRNYRRRWWMGRWIVSMCFVPRTSRFSSPRPEVFHFSASWGVRSLIWILSGML